LTFYNCMLNFISGEKKTFLNPMDPFSFLWRKIGGVNIFELRGKLAEPWVDQLGEEMSKVLNVHPARGLLMNFLQVEEEDDLGAQVVLETLRRSKKPGILIHEHSNCFVLRRMNDHSQDRIPLFKNTHEAVSYFEKEFVLDDFEERRQYPRIKTALPVQFRLEDGKTGGLQFEAIVTNMSLGGLLTKFLDSHTEALVKKQLDPFDLRLLRMQLELPDGEVVEVEGKALRMQNGAIAVEFYKLAPGNKGKLEIFLDRFMESQKLEDN